MNATPETMVHDVTQEFQALIDDVTNEESRHRTAYEVERTLFRRLLALGAVLLRLFFTSRAAARPSEPRTTLTGRLPARHRRCAWRKCASARCCGPSVKKLRW